MAVLRVEDRPAVACQGAVPRAAGRRVADRKVADRLAADRPVADRLAAWEAVLKARECPRAGCPAAAVLVVPAEKAVPTVELPVADLAVEPVVMERAV